MSTHSQILAVLEKEQIEPSENVRAMCELIMARHQDRVQALLYYGSSLRAMNDPAKMLDFYVLVDSYRKTHKNPVRALLNALIPPAVYYLENTNADGTISTCKYSVISLGAFERKCTKKALLSMIWGRFSQPCVLLFPKDEAIKTRIQNARVNAVTHLANQITPLVESPVEMTKFWARGFMDSYRTELRPERSDTRSEEIVNRYENRYKQLMQILYGPANKDKTYALQPASSWQKFTCKWLWFWRRVLGKPVAGIRVLNSAFTFDGGLDYLLHKLKSHSGVTIPVTDHQRRHPLLWAPILAWKLYRKGAFR